MLCKTYILNIVLLYFLGSYVQAKGKSAKPHHRARDVDPPEAAGNATNNEQSAELTTANMVENIRRQLLDNNYDYTQSAERRRSPRAQPTMRMQRLHPPAPPPPPPPPAPAQHAPVQYDQRQLDHLFSKHRKATTPRHTSALPQLFNEAKYKHLQQDEDEFLPPSTFRYKYTRKSTRPRLYYNQRLTATTTRRQFLAPLITDSRDESPEAEDRYEAPATKSTRRASSVRRQPYPHIDVQYKHPPSPRDLYLQPPLEPRLEPQPPPAPDPPRPAPAPLRPAPARPRPRPAPATTRRPAPEARGRPVEPTYSTIPTYLTFPTYPTYSTSTIYTSSWTTHKKKPKKSKRTTLRKRKRLVPRRGRGPTIPDSLWEQDYGPFETAHYTPDAGRDAPLAKKYHFRAAPPGPALPPPEPAATADNSTGVRISVIKVKQRSADGRRAAYRRLVQEESPRGVALLLLDALPPPQFQLPAPWRQYMQPSASMEDMHELQ